MAHKCGDDTALQMGRLTLNPLAHLDPFGTLCFLMFRFGWAKPVPVNPHNFRRPSRDNILVSIAGVSANFLSALALALVFRIVVLAYGESKVIAELLSRQPSSICTVLMLLQIGVFINLVLIFFNLIPIPPLDGSHVLEELLPWDLRQRYVSTVKMYGPFILIAFVIIGGRIGLLHMIIVTPTSYIWKLLVGNIGLLLQLAYG